MPDIGDYTDIPVIEVLVAVGDTVKKDQGLVTLESDKATMEVPSSVAGVVKELKVRSATPCRRVPWSPSSRPKALPHRPRARPLLPPPRPLPRAPPVEPVAVPAQPDKLAAREIASAGTPSSPPVQFNADGVLPAKVPYATPAVRVFARELGVDLLQVNGTEKGGRITKGDVQKFVKAALSGGVPAAGGGAVAAGGGLNLLPWPKVDFSKFGETEVQPLSRIKKISGANLARNWAMIPHVTQFEQADITDLEALRVALNKENERPASS